MVLAATGFAFLTGTGFTAKPFSTACAAASTRLRMMIPSPFKGLKSPTLLSLRATKVVPSTSMAILPTVFGLKSTISCHKISTRLSLTLAAHTGRAPTRMPAMS